MHHLEVDWLELARRAAVWSALPLDMRVYLLRFSGNDTIPDLPLGTERSRLERERIVAVASTGRIALDPSHRPHSRALRAMCRHDLLAHPTVPAFIDYLHEQYTVAERRQLADRTLHWSDSAHALVRHVSSAEWLRPALDAAASATDAWGDAGRIVRTMLERGGTIDVAELPRLLDGIVPLDRLSTAVNTALGRVWLIATMRHDDLLPMLMLWPASVARLRRAPAAAPQPHTPAYEAGLPFLMDDAAALLIAASSEPLRMRGSDHSLFAKAVQRIEATLVPLPSLLHTVTNWAPETRIAQALMFMRTLRCVRVAGRAGADLRLEVSKSGREWLAAPPVERLRRLAEAVRPVRRTRAERNADGIRASRASHLRIVNDDAFDSDDLDGPYVDDEPFDDEEPYYDNDVRQLDLLGHNIQPAALRRTLENAAVAAYTDRDSTFVLLESFASYHAEHHNPLMSVSHRRYGYVDGSAPVAMTVEERETWWANLLAGVLLNRLVPLGGAVLGHVEGSGTGFRVTAAGRYLLGLDGPFDITDIPGLAGGHNASAQIIIQPNFDVVFLAPAPSAEAEIGRFAERVGNGIGTLFRITRDAVFAAASAGVTGDAARNAMRRLSSQPVPLNVAGEVAGWFAACRHATAGMAYLLRFPDEETATRALTVTGRDTMRIAPTILEIVQPRQRTAVLRKLRKQGIFVEETGDETASSGRRRRGHRV